MKKLLIGLLALASLSCFAGSKWPSSKRILEIVYDKCGLEAELSPECKRDRKFSKELVGNKLLVAFECVEELSGRLSGDFVFDPETETVVENSIQCE